jgi:hypothetical protein
MSIPSRFSRSISETRAFTKVENMERPAPDCKGRHKSIKLMRHGGA